MASLPKGDHFPLRAFSKDIPKSFRPPGSTLNPPLQVSTTHHVLKRKAGSADLLNEPSACLDPVSKSKSNSQKNVIFDTATTTSGKDKLLPPIPTAKVPNYKKCEVGRMPCVCFDIEYVPAKSPAFYQPNPQPKPRVTQPPQPPSPQYSADLPLTPNTTTDSKTKSNSKSKSRKQSCSEKINIEAWTQSMVERTNACNAVGRCFEGGAAIEDVWVGQDMENWPEGRKAKMVKEWGRELLEREEERRRVRKEKGKWRAGVEDCVEE